MVTNRTHGSASRTPAGGGITSETARGSVEAYVEATHSASARSAAGTSPTTPMTGFNPSPARASTAVTTPRTTRVPSSTSTSDPRCTVSRRLSRSA